MAAIHEPVEQRHGRVLDDHHRSPTDAQRLAQQRALSRIGDVVEHEAEDHDVEPAVAERQVDAVEQAKRAGRRRLVRPDVDDVDAEQLARALGGQLFEHVPFATADVQHGGPARNVGCYQRRGVQCLLPDGLRTIVDRHVCPPLGRQSKARANDRPDY